ncbi:uncharacterized protein CBL_13271 [Carabus blaptoides fortunei]
MIVMIAIQREELPKIQALFTHVMKMQLCLDRSWVLIMDYETGTVMERFPASLIQEPTAFTSNDPMDLYNNILVFIVGNTGNGHNSHPEMHIFQCQSISAEDLVEDLKQLRAGKPISSHRNSSIPPPPAKSPPHPPGIVSMHRDPSMSYNAYRESESELTGINDEISSTTSEKYERDVTILNHCFDDIEKFIARLQHAAAASRELERRRRNRKTKKRDLGDGMLTMRTKPPPEKEFIDIFQKFKLSFNLLAKLKAHIHDPNAPELVHFLFTPLALIVDASHETYYDPNLPAKVVSPLLTREAVNLLMNCVTSKETELWHSLGNAWLVPRDQWKGHVSLYHPVFMDGWSPEFHVTDETESTVDTKPNRELLEDETYDYYDQKIDPSTPERDLPSSLRDLSVKSDISVDSIERCGNEDRFDRSQDGWLEDLQTRGANIVQVTYPRTANNDKELTVARGEFLEILDDSRKWWKARNWRGQMAHVPHTIVTPFHYGNPGNSSDHNDIFNNPLYSRNRRDSPLETFSGGMNPSTGDHGPSVPPADWVVKERIGTNTPPPPPPPPPFPEDATKLPAEKQAIKIPSPEPKLTLSSKSSTVSQDDINEELKNVLAQMKQRKHRVLDVLKTPEVYIKPASNSNEVQKWLKEKGFSPSVCKLMSNITGNELFNFSREQLEQICGSVEGKRLASQITLQKKICGFTIGRNSELNTILKQTLPQLGHIGTGQNI